MRPRDGKDGGMMGCDHRTWSQYDGGIYCDVCAAPVRPEPQRVAVVTGASRGIGHEVARMLAHEGWRVVGVSRTRPTDLPEHQSWIAADVGLAHQAARLAAVGRIDALVHCAAVRGPYGPFWENDPSEWLAAIRTNLLGTYHVVQAALPLLMRSEDGRILLFSGGGAFDPSPGYSAYATAKSGVVGLMETLAADLEGTRVTVNCVAPGYVATDIHAGTPEEGKDDQGAMELAVACVRHLLSPETRGLTGKTISARWDAWERITPATVGAINASGAGMRRRSLISNIEIAHLMRRSA
jgi:NAD(P)-dependent dehydrogenase (short-subunit alcohol dehydrogenase family)